MIFHQHVWIPWKEKAVGFFGKENLPDNMKYHFVGDIQRCARCGRMMMFCKNLSPVQIEQTDGQ